MSYDIKKTNGEQLVELEENTLDLDTVSSVALIGKLLPDYGTYQSENFVHLTENFANNSFPKNPLIGQLVYNTDKKCLYVYEEKPTPTWTKLAAVSFAPSEDPITGDMYYNESEKKFYVYDGNLGTYVLIGPENYEHRSVVSAVLKTSNTITSDKIAIDIENDTSTLVTIKIVAREIIVSTKLRNKEPESLAIIYKALINNYQNNNGTRTVKFVGEPNYQLIGRTEGTSDWKFEPVIDNKQLKIDVYGVGIKSATVTDKEDYVSWEIEIEKLKV